MGDRVAMDEKMERKILIAPCLGRIVSALVENGTVVELHYSTLEDDLSIGDIYIGKVTRILPNTPGAFIQLQSGKEFFYKTTEKTPPLVTSRPSEGTLRCGDELVVQIKKEASGEKKPIVTGEWNLTGRYAVLLPSSSKRVSVSSRLPQSQRDELRQRAEDFLDSVLPQMESSFGVILRTNAGSVAWSAVEADILQLLERGADLLSRASTRTCFSCLYRAPRSFLSILRDCRREGLQEIVVETEALYGQVRDHLASEQPEDVSKLRLYEDPSWPLSRCWSLEHLTEQALKEKVWMKSGAYLVIQYTEALTVIDVNSGKCTQKKNFASINLEAAKEAARQIRLRNLSGIILIDFINLDRTEEKKELLKFLQKELNRDSNPGTVVDMTRLQLTEITRKKVRNPLHHCFPESSLKESPNSQPGQAAISSPHTAKKETK